jgi:aromatic ring-opening dioxygenase LigB subunit
VIVFAAIAPHGDIAIEEATDDLSLGQATRDGMAELARRFEAAKPEATILFTPHNAHVERHFGVVVAAALKGGLGDFLPGGAAPLELEVPVDRALARDVLDALGEAGIPAVGVSFGGNAADEDFDARIVELVESGRLDRLLELDPGLVADAKADSYWQLLLLAGAVGGHGTVELLSYEAPSYYGMLTASISF